MSSDKKITIAIDGYSSCGKSTLAKELAKELNYLFVDSGAMYRAVTYYAMKEGLIENQKSQKANMVSLGYFSNIYDDGDTCRTYVRIASQIKRENDEVHL